MIHCPTKLFLLLAIASASVRASADVDFPRDVQPILDQGAPRPDDADVAAARAKAKRDHWAFKAPVRPPLPEVKDAAWPRSPIDRFVLARLEKEGLRPSPGADKTTLLRRLSLDLTGLPPGIEDIDAFLADGGEGAYAEQVERLLQSPHHGERWGRHWLDAARYADSDGYEKDKLRSVWFYRDWVINAFNRDLPYDQFIIEQMAGDLLPHATQDQIVATGFLRNSMVNEEGGVDPEQFRMDAMFDRMDAIGKSILGLTIQCGQCHSHKYDPLTQEEYYRLFAFINNDHEEQRLVYTREEEAKTAELSRRLGEIEDALRRSAPDWEERMSRWEEETKRRGEPRWVVVTPSQVSEGNTRFFEQPDGSLLGLGYAPTKFDFVFRAAVDLPAIRSFRLELITDPNLPCGGPGRSIRGTCALTEFRVEAASAGKPDEKFPVSLVQGIADYANPERELEPIFDDRSGKKRVTGPVEYCLDGKDETAWGIDAGPGRRNVDREAVFVAEKDAARPGGTILTFHLVNNHGGWNSDDNQNNNIGRFRLSVSGEVAAAGPLPRRLRDALAVPRDRRSRAQAAAIFAFWRTTVPEWKDANDSVEALWREWPAGTTTLTLQAREVPRRTAILKRGDWLTPGDAVTPGVPAFLHELPGAEEPGRLAFARWLADRRSPTTARAIVNRVWQAYFGTGIVDTPEDFGLQSAGPSHPELLDWLACELMDRGWSLKALHRLIVTSAAYRQSSRVTPELHARDPHNRLIARGPRLRVEGEVVRDIALASSGLLNPRIGGPGIFSPAPAFLFQPPASYGPFEWREETGPDRYRRALYTFRRRSTPYPALQTFDAPNGDFSCVRRTRSNTALQALVTLNEATFVECARALASRTLERAGKTAHERITYAFRRVLGRPPTPEEREDLEGLLERQVKRIAEGWVNATEIATGKGEPPSRVPAGATPAELAAYTVVSRVLLNLDETITKE